MIHLNVDRAYQNLNFSAQLKQAALETLQHQEAATDAELSLALTGDAQLKKLNEKFMGEAKATDVLSFPSDEVDYLGDVVISVPRARAQARASGNSLLAELQLLTVHGVLHLLGHDHSDPKEKSRMWAAQNEILGKLGAKISSPSVEQAAAES